MDNPDGNRQPVWNPGPSGASQNQFIQSAAAESSTSVSDPASRQFPALAAAANPYPDNAFQQRSLQDVRTLQSQYQGMFDIAGTHSQAYESAQSSYSRASSGSYRDMPSGSDEASSYPMLRIGEDNTLIMHHPAVGSSTGSQSGYQQVPQMLVDEGNRMMVPPRVASPVDSTVSQSVNREPAASADIGGNRHIIAGQIMLPSSNQFSLVQASVASYTQSEVTTSGGSPQDDDISQDQRDLDLNQIHGEAEPQDRHSSHGSQDIDMDEAVSSISDQGRLPERPRLATRPSHPIVDDGDEIAGEPDTTQEDDEDTEMREDNAEFTEDDEAEAVQSSVVPGPSRPIPGPSHQHSTPIAMPSHPVPSTSGVMDSDIEQQQRQQRSTRLAPHARMTSLTASLFASSQNFRTPQSPGIPFPSSLVQSPSHMIPSISNEIQEQLLPTQFSASQVVVSSSTVSANQLVTTGASSTVSANQLAPTMSSTNVVSAHYGENEQEPDVDSSAMGDNLCNGVVASLPDYDASSSAPDVQNDDEQPGTSKQSPKRVRKSVRLQEMEDDKPSWHREDYLPRPYDPDKLWCDVCQVAYDTECEQHSLNAVSDKIVFSRAWSSLPSCLQIYRLLDSEQLGVFAKRPISKFTQFGPFVGELTEREVMLTNSGMPVLVERDDDVLYYDTSDENKCNWMMFVRPATYFAEQNLVMYQYGQEIYYTVTKPIEHKVELKVWYASHYADRHNLNRLEPTEQDISILEETEFKFQCFECSKKFRTAIALQKHLFEHDEETGSSKVESTWDSLLEQERKPARKPRSQVSQIRKKLLAARKLKESASDTAASPLYHWKKRSTNIYLNKTLKKYHKRPGSDARKSVQSMYRKTGKDAEWTCVSCDLTFDNASVLNLHTLTHAAENVGQDELTKLLYTADTAGQQNEKSPYLIMNEAFGGQGQDGVGAGTSQETHTLACPVCTAQFTHMMALVEHAAEHGKSKTKFPNFHRPFKCDKCWKAFTTQERLTQHFQCHGPDDAKQFQCKFCGKRFVNNSAMSCHMKTHSIHKYYECPLCHIGFDHAAAMRDHSQMHLSPEGLFNCPHCDKKFSEFLVLKKHIRGFHNNKYYQCDVCAKVFPREDKLRLHKLCHSSVREFMCETCGRQFKRKDKLKEHIKRLHSLERQIKDIEKALKQPRVKFVPKVSPTDYQRFIYKCHLCLLGFKRRGMLVNHLANKHPGIKPDSVPELNLPILKTQRDYYCQYCDKVYKSSSKRKSHILKNHPGLELPMSARKKIPIEESAEGIDNPTYSQTVGSITTMPHSCEHCHKQYASKAKLMQHQRKKHAGLVPAAAERSKRDKINIGQLPGQEGTPSVIHVVEAYNSDGQPVPGADLLTQAMSELTQTIQEYRQNTPGAPELYQVSARLGASPPTMVQIQAGNGGTGSTIELTHLSQALSQFSPGQSHIQVAVSGTGQQIQIPIVTQALQQFSPGISHIQVSVAGSNQPVQIPILTKQDSGGTDSGDTITTTEGAGTVTTQAVSYQPLNLVSGNYIPKTWTNYTYK